MTDRGYNGGSTPQGLWGSTTAAVVGVSVFFFLLLADVLGDCVPEEPCRKGFIAIVLVPTVFITSVVVAAVWFAVKRLRRSDDG